MATLIAIALASAIACGTLTPAVERSVLSVDPLLVRSVIKNESAFQPRALSLTGAQGLMQIEPATGRGLTLCDPNDPAQNIIAGTRYLKSQLDRFHNVRLAVAAYNAGPEAVSRYHDIPPYAETQHYVAAVMGDYARYVRESTPSTPVPGKAPNRSPRLPSRRPVMQVFAEYGVATQNAMRVPSEQNIMRTP